ncbi:exopolyphosphatase [Jonquetella anthropi DSM 22815]|uniref:Exopolyphosphatase n=1 Tax=Jonquetella anthropi DSM 22815 TaxID=885272 RepID=H0UJ50_9BACT|nr:phosphatase [Jonquetella anthropi]EEX48920.1 Ppx/GppA phosphatase family protein [Jonquetella anthropi E3_33 E1]EHM12783.1 exopolyphosphatase [Jonquetella anthropi DSM 22815]
MKASLAAVIDVGTNSVKYCLAEGDRSGITRILDEGHRVTKLGRGESPVLTRQAMEETAAAAASFAAAARRAGAVPTACGTHAVRNAANRDEFLEIFERETGVFPAVLTASQEAQLTFEAPGVLAGPLTVVDSGGGSTEFSFGADGRLEGAFSVPLGALSITAEFSNDPPTPGQLADVRLKIRRTLESSSVCPALGKRIVASGGTAVVMAAAARGLDASPACDVLTPQYASRLLALFSGKSAAERRQIPGVPADRADVILGGTCILAEALSLLGNEAAVTTRGLRHAVLARLFSGRWPLQR